MPECIKKECPNYGEVKFRNRCGKLNTNDVCPVKGLILQINATTLQPSCSLNLASRFDEAEEDNCYPGSKRAQEELCTPAP